jgi:hypothetical protein
VREKEVDALLDLALDHLPLISHVVANRTPLGELTVNPNTASVTMATTVDTNNEKGKEGHCR